MEKCYDLLVCVVGKLLETKQEGLVEKMWGESGEVKTIALINVKECTPVTVYMKPPKQTVLNKDSLCNCRNKAF